MCGILLVAEAGEETHPQAKITSFETGLRARGPDHFGTVQVRAALPAAHSSTQATSSSRSTSNSTSSTACNLSMTMAASLLQLRGSTPSTSPLIDNEGNVLSFNGEIFAGLDISEGGNDGKALLAALQQAGQVSAADAIEAAGKISDAALSTSETGQLSGPASSSSNSKDSSSGCSSSSSDIAAPHVMGVLSKLRGPWSLLYWQEQQQVLWFGRDVMGKRSLLMQLQHGCLVLTSVTPQQLQQQQQPRAAWVEVPPGVYSIGAQDLLKLLTTSSSSSSSSNGGASEQDVAAAGAAANGPAGATGFLPTHLRPANGASSAEDGIEGSANRGVSTARDLCAVSPGLRHHRWLDAQLLQLQQYQRSSGAAATADVGSAGQAQPAAANLSPDAQRQQQQQHVCQEGQSPAAALQKLQLHPDWQNWHQRGREQQPQLAMPQQEGHSAQQQQQQQQCAELEVASQQLLQVMQAGINVRCLTINTLQHRRQQQACAAVAAADASLVSSTFGSPGIAAASSTASSTAGLPPAPILILFSGGLDSTLIAALAHRALPPGVPIDLSNVCFDRGRSADRAAARAATLELAAYAPDRPWRLIEVDSSLEEVDQLAQHIKGLLHPAATVMDWNIGSALWLAAKAEGQVWVPVCQPDQQQQGEVSAGPQAVSGVAEHQAWRLELAHVGVCSCACSSGDSTADLGVHQQLAPGLQCQQPGKQQQEQAAGLYKSAARVVLLGHGADEQCGGYGRHRTKYRHAGLQGVAEELALDVNRLWLRNLGRDDRLIADHGREGRHPFLDEDVMTFLQQLPLNLMVDYTQPPGVGDKRILRHLLASLGLPQAAGREKRAIQFGTRLANLSNRREFGSNRKANRVQAGSLKSKNVST